MFQKSEIKYSFIIFKVINEKINVGNVINL